MTTQVAEPMAAQQSGAASATPEGVQAVEGQKPQEQAQTPDIERRLAEQEEKIIRQVQKMVGKADDRINKRVKEDLRSLEASLKLQRDSGMEINADQEARLRQKVVENAMTAEPQQPAPQTTGASAPEGQPAQQLDPVVARALNKMNKVGAMVEQNDPEFAQIQQALEKGDPDEFEIAAIDAARAKKARLASQAERSAGRVPSGGAVEPSSGVPEGASAHSLIEDGYRKK